MSRDLGVEMFMPYDQFVYLRGESELAARALGLGVRASPFVANTSGSVIGMAKRPVNNLFASKAPPKPPTNSAPTVISPPRSSVIIRPPQRVSLSVEFCLKSRW